MRKRISVSCNLLSQTLSSFPSNLKILTSSGIRPKYNVENMVYRKEKKKENLYRKLNKNIQAGQRIKGRTITMMCLSRRQAYDWQVLTLKADQFPCEKLPKVAVLYPASSTPTNLAQLEGNRMNRGVHIQNIHLLQSNTN